MSTDDKTNSSLTPEKEPLLETPVVERSGTDIVSFKDEPCWKSLADSFDVSLSASSSPHKIAKPKGKPFTGSNIPLIPAATPRDNDDDDTDRIRLGICAIDKKARSRPMAEILSRLDENLFRVVFFGDNVLQDAPASDWPICDVLIAFYSKGYPLNKAKEYVRLRKPYILNDLDMQELMQDRRKVYDLLELSGIDVPRHVYLSRDDYVSTGSGDGDRSGDQEVKEFDDHIIVNGVLVNKPFVEKPVNAEDHNITIYYPTTAGGGCKKLFRKIGNRSSEFYSDLNEVRRNGSYIYEEFVETQGTDVKMYTVGPDYGHAEARKSPAVDGKVERNSEGKEVRYPVILTYREKEIARRIVLVFKQWICGFDILRVQECHSLVSYVCDVNGFSFVKNSRKYYDDCAQILSEHVLAATKPTALHRLSTLDPLVTFRLNQMDDTLEEKKAETSFLSRAASMLQGEPGFVEGDADDGDQSVASDINGDFSHQGRSPDSEMAAPAATTLVEGALPVREFPNDLTSAPAAIAGTESDGFYDDNPRHGIPRSGSISQEGTHQEELRCVLAIIRHGDRTPKQKLKVNMSEPHILQYFHNHSKDCRKDLKVKAKTDMIEFLQTVKTTLGVLNRTSANESLRHELLHMRDILERWKIVGLNRKLQIKPRKFEPFVDGHGENRERCTSVQLILKWGGNLTRLGEKQSINMGQRLRHEMYPDANGGGILRLHSTFRHDLKIKTSDEGRVMKTAAAFAKGLLELEGDLPPILVSLVHKEKGSFHMLDPSGNKEVKLELDECKEKITANMQRDIDISTASEADLERLAGPKEITSIRKALAAIKNPRKALKAIHDTMGELISQLDEMLDAMGSGDETRNEGGEGLKGEGDQYLALSGVKLYKGETLLELTERWRFIYDKLCDSETDTYDLSRIPDVHDNVRFDVLHNPHLGLMDTLHKLYELAKNVADCVVPQEYGTTIAEKRSVGAKICHGLLEKIKYDLSVARTDYAVEPMRFMINTDYSQDLPINTMGRRIRTRLYFTSESHLHTVLNVLRFAQGNDGKPILSKAGTEIVNSTPELCYLTHIVMRVFDDSRPEMQNDPKRFRVEILFSPGATATPVHLQETDRETDSFRFDTAPLQVIGRECLSCEELEAFFGKAIIAGRSDDEEYPEAESMSTMPERYHRVLKKDRKKEVPVYDTASGLSTFSEVDSSDVDHSFKASPCTLPTSSDGSVATSCFLTSKQGPGSADNHVRTPGGEAEAVEKGTGASDTTRDAAEASLVGSMPSSGDVPPYEDVAEDADDTHTVFARKRFWSTVAIGSFVLGATCLLVAMRLADDSRQRRWSSPR